MAKEKDKVGSFNFGFNAKPKATAAKAKGKAPKGTSGGAKKGGKNAWQSYTGGA